MSQISHRFEARQAIRQWLACAHTFLDIPQFVETAIYDHWSAYPPEPLKAWHARFVQDLLDSRNGYPMHAVSREPYTEQSICELLKMEDYWQDSLVKPTRPTLYLSHDIDYLAPTSQMILKRMVSQRQLKVYPPGTQFLDSLERLLKLDCEAASGKNGVSTLFVPYALRSPNPLQWLHQWLIDPSYHEKDHKFARLRELIERYDCSVGLHGSFYSLSNCFIEKERECLSRHLERPIVMSRQHWLNLPVPDAFERLKKAGFFLDSTLGWNGTVGFRGGMARPFPLCLDGNETIWEVPLLLMDGPLFDDLKLEPDAVVTLSCQLLELVYQVGGKVSINWHERAAFTDYGWDTAYEKILMWAKARGFEFQPMSQLLETADRL